MMLVIDGSQGEGGGQILRTSLSLSALTQRPFRLTNIRAGRAKPGLRPQHLTAVRAVAAICEAHLVGDALNSTTLEFWPQSRPRGGRYDIDVADAAAGGSAGAVTLILEAMLWPLLFADAPSTVTLHGGTHVPFSPPYHYVAHVAHPVWAALGAVIKTELMTWGWYPVGGGKITAAIEPVTGLQTAVLEPAKSRHVRGVAAVTNLPAHIPHRMARRAYNLLHDAGYEVTIQEIRARGPGPGAGMVLWLPYAGFTSLGRKGLPADKVAEMAVAQLQTFEDNNTLVGPHLADQLLLPLALAKGSTTFATSRLTHHTLTNAHLLHQWLDAAIYIVGERDKPGEITLTGINFTRS